MKNLILIILTILFINQNLILSQDSIQNKHALIIAIGDYPFESGWSTINRS